MKLKSMQATFGRLDRKKLDLQPGLNVISGGNETGKSTWAEFLTAMLYGVDTRARGKGAELPVKTKYEP
ncbi:MAG: ATP-binding protein, partial [Oscillospiraceae bacterium]|nr:ATP-binding protein [Oscillospiraceae bacterium]